MTARWPTLTAAQEHDAYREGFRLWDASRFFEAHEAWETVWRSAIGEKRSFYQGLIQFAVGMLKLQRGQRQAALRLFELARQKWAGLPAGFLGLDRDEFLRTIAAALA